MSNRPNVEAVCVSADFPSRTMTFHVPKGTEARAGVYRIVYERPAEDEDWAPYEGLPEHDRCPTCAEMAR